MKLKYIAYTILLFLGVGSFGSCSYLDVVPDNVATLDDAFVNRREAEKYLYTCYSYLPEHNTAWGNIGMYGADELWTFHPLLSGSNTFESLNITKGFQNRNSPYMNYWSGERGAKPYYRAINDCNIFIENVSDKEKVYDLNTALRMRWLSEVKFLKAYYHFYLFRMYGPIVVLDENYPVTATPGETYAKRMPVDDVVTYIEKLIDESLEFLPEQIIDASTELGRVTKPAALALKARLLLTAASPLFNGNEDYKNFVDKDGVNLFNTAYDPQKWAKAEEACRIAIESAEENNVSLYKFSPGLLALSDPTLTQMSIRNSVAEKWNTETIWGLSGRLVNSFQADCMARLDPQYSQNMWSSRDMINPTIDITNYYYTDNGIPIEEDVDWDYVNRYKIRIVNRDERFNLIDGYDVASLHFNRENRYYANLAFDGSIWYMENSKDGSGKVLEDKWTVKAREGQPQSRMGQHNYSETGYWLKKFVNWKFVIEENSHKLEEYPWVEFRLAELYLSYAEALNEVGKRDDAIAYLDKVRERAGLKGVKESWLKSIKQDKYKSEQGLREIIQQERTIELMFEGHRYWDQRRWKTAQKTLNRKIHGWSLEQESAEGYYRQRALFNLKFIAPRDYLSPLKEYDLIINKNLVQNPGW